MSTKSSHAGTGRHHLPIAIAVILGASLLNGCGGGSGGGMVRSSPPPAEPPPAPPPPVATVVNLDGSQATIKSGESLTDVAARSLSVDGGGFWLAGSNSFAEGVVIKDGYVSLDPGLTGTSTLDADATVMGGGEYVIPGGSGLTTPTGEQPGMLFVGYSIASDGSYVPAVLNGDVSLAGGVMFVEGVVNGNISNNGYLFIDSVPERDASDLQGVNGNVAIGSGGWTWLDSTIHGNVENAGILQVHAQDAEISNELLDEYSAAGHARIDGDYAQTASGILEMTFGSDFSVSGTATLAGTLRYYNDDVSQAYLPSNGVDTVLHADAGITGSFDNLEYTESVLLRGALEYLANDVLFHVTQQSAQSVMGAAGADPLTMAGARQVDAAFRVADGLTAQPRSALTSIQRRFLDSAGRLQRLHSVEQAAASFDSLSGQSFASSRSQLLDSFSGYGPSLSQLRQWRQDSMANPAWTTSNMQTTAGGTGLMQGRVSEAGGMTGTSHRLGPQMLVGVAAGNGDAWMDFDRGGGRAHARQSLAMFYGQTWRGPWYAYGEVQGGRGRMDSLRWIELGDGRQHQAVAGFDMNLMRARLEGGFDHALAGGRLTPFAGLRYDAIRSAAFAETGDTGFELVGQAADSRRLDTEVGLRYARDWQLGSGWLRLDAAGARRHVLNADGDTLAAAFSGAPEAVFRIDDARASDASSFDLQLQAGRGAGWSGALRYRWNAGDAVVDRGWWMGFERKL